MHIYVYSIQSLSLSHTHGHSDVQFEVQMGTTRLAFCLRFFPSNCHCLQSTPSASHSIANVCEEEVEQNACGSGGECEHFKSSHSSNAAACGSSSSIYLELWHACAGAVTLLPKKGDLVVYFPQGHLEQADSSTLPSFDLPPQILCRVVDVQILANKENDEVYTQLTLHPMPQMVGVKLEGKEKENVGVDEGGNGESPAKSRSHMFCKTLTASDTSTHGGFSVPRRAAEDCFPPLNYGEQRPSQELVATDLHGVEWKFRHIYRGQPRRHLLTTGWSIFVNQKNLASGDAVLFLRGESGDLRLGIRRAARPRNGLPDSIIHNQNYYPNLLSCVANALSSNGTFEIVYSPRASHSAFIVPYQKYLKCTASRIPVGTRFKMKYGLDDSPERRFSGVVTGVSDADPNRWPNSQWRSLMVRWDEVVDHQKRVSPWDIYSSCSYAPPRIHPFPGMKRPRSNLEASPNGSSLSRGGLVSDFEEYVRSSKVLQGQENVGLMSPPHTTFTGFLESNRFPKVLQGQEICSFRSLAGWSYGARLKPRRGCNVVKAHQYQTPSSYPLASEGARNLPFPMISSSRAGNAALTPGSTTDVGQVTYESRAVEKTCAPETASMHLKNMSKEDESEKVPICKVFGFSLTQDPATLNAQGQSTRSCTQVHKQGSRAMNLSQLHRYDNLLSELERMFSMEEGLVRDPNHGGRTLYADSDKDLVVGSMAHVSQPRAAAVDSTK